ncbi:hypothetical protein QZH41_002557 [Actinostola sp. cb2023]|nr:hypothetical protein QZH41_002557 [Actinostola sp. cb2023]
MSSDVTLRRFRIPDVQAKRAIELAKRPSERQSREVDLSRLQVILKKVVQMKRLQYYNKGTTRSPLLGAFLSYNRRTPINTVADIIGEDFVQIRMRKAQNVKDKLNQCRVDQEWVFA